MSATWHRRTPTVEEILDRLSPGPPQGPAADAWEPPVPLTARRLLPPFPVDVLPAWVAAQVRAVAEFTQTPPDLAGCVALAALSAAAGGRAVVEARPGWLEPVNLYTVVALSPGSRKSAVFAAMTAPLLAAERELVAKVRPLIVQAEMEKQVSSRLAERAAAAAANASDAVRADALAEASGAALNASAISVPMLPRLIADDITPEAAASLLAEQGGRLAVLSAEGGIFATMAGRYSSGTPNLEVFLKGHAGDLLRVDRKGRPAEHVEHPALTIGLAVQPEILTQLADLPGFRGRGLLARLLYSLPENTVGRRRVDPDPVPAGVAQAYDTRLRDLVLALAGGDEPLVLTPTADAARAVLGLAAAIEPRLGTAGDLAHITDWAAKLVGAIVRIAGLIHLADRRNGLLDGDTVDAAAHLGHYFLAHALATFEHMGADPLTEDAQHVLDWITRTSTAGSPSANCSTPWPAAASARSPTSTPPSSSSKATATSAPNRSPPDPARAAAGRAPRPTTSTPYITPQNPQNLQNPPRTEVLQVLRILRTPSAPPTRRPEPVTRPRSHQAPPDPRSLRCHAPPSKRSSPSPRSAPS